jgi:POT family proton-dependent oligopeptide transporter
MPGDDLSATTQPQAADMRPQWFGHPAQLARLFTTEMWERFGYYGMRALLTLFLADHFLFSDATTGGLYGAFTSLVYLTPLFGGLLADRYLGNKRAVKLGALLMALGYLGLCFNGPAAKPWFSFDGNRYQVSIEKDGEVRRQYIGADGLTLEIKGREGGGVALVDKDGVARIELAPGSYESGGDRSALFVGLMLLSLSFVVVGNGLFKPNISTIVGALYAPGDTRRDAGFTIFYMGINLGSLISQFFAPLLALWYGWWAGFALAAVGMFVAFALFQFDGGRLAGYGEAPEGVSRRTGLWVVLGALAAIPVIWYLLDNSMVNAEAAAAAARSGAGVLAYIASLPLLGQVLFLIFGVSVLGIPLWAWLKGSREEFHKMVVATVLIVFTVVFWTLFEQAGSSLTFFASRNTDLQIGSYLMPAGQAQIFNPLFIVILAPLFSMLWVALGKRGLEPSIPVKFAIALLLVGAGFLFLVFGTRFAGADYRVGLGWLAGLYLIHTLGELCLSPVGLSMITKLAMARVVAMMMGVFFLASAMAQYVGGVVAQVASVETVGGEVTNPALSLSTYVGVFTGIGWAAVGIGLFLLALSPLLKRWMHGVN